MLIRDINKDITKPNFIFSMAPILESMQYNDPGMGGFVYKELFNSPEGKLITYFNVQSYNSFSKEDFDKIILNGYPKEKIVLGMIYSQSLDICLSEIKNIILEYDFIGGIFIWEYCFADNKNPLMWAEKISNILQNKKICSIQ